MNQAERLSQKFKSAMKIYNIQSDKKKKAGWHWSFLWSFKIRCLSLVDFWNSPNYSEHPKLSTQIMRLRSFYSIQLKEFTWAKWFFNESSPPHGKWKSFSIFSPLPTDLMNHTAEIHLSKPVNTSEEDLGDKINDQSTTEKLCRVLHSCLHQASPYFLRRNPIIIMCE